MKSKYIVQHRIQYIVLIGVVLSACTGTGGGSSRNNSPATSSGSSTIFTVNQQGEAPACTVLPRSREFDIRSFPTDNGTIIGKLPANNWVQVSHRSEGGWYQVYSPGTPVDDGWLIARGADLTQPCACGEKCLQFELPAETIEITDCEVSFEADNFITIYFLPDTTSSIFAVSTAGDDAAGVAQAITDDNWIGYDPRIQSSEAGVERLRWIQGSNSSVALNGTQCIDLPTYSYTAVEG